jgi:hypothetical protein
LLVSSNIIERHAEDLVEEVDVDEFDQELIKTVKYKEALEALDVLSLFKQQQAEGSDKILRKIGVDIKSTALQRRQSNKVIQLRFEPGNVAALWSRARN